MNTIPALFERASLLCWSSRRWRFILFSLLTVFVVLAYGYYFGTFDQSSHIPFLKKTIDPTLYPNDRFFNLRISHYSYFWLLFIPFYKAGLLEVALFGIYLITTFLTFWALWDLSMVLFRNAKTALLATLALALPHIGFSGFPMFEFSMLNRTVMLPFELIALRFYLEKKYFVAFLILGVLYNFHALSVHFVLAMIGVDMLFSLFNKRDGKAFLAVPGFLICAVPVLIWKFSHSGVETGVQKEWFNLLNLSTFYHLFNFISVSYPVVNFLTAGGICALILFFFVVRRIPKKDMHERVIHFMYGGIVVLLVQAYATLFFPFTLLIQSQVVRIGTFLTLFAYLYIAHFIVTRQRSASHFVFFSLSLILSISPLFLFLSFLFWRINRTGILRLMTLIAVAMFIGVLSLLAYFNLARPGIHIWPEKTAFYDVQLWAKNNTPKHARFITPPEKWWLYEVEWRVGSERSTVSTLSELLEGAFDPSYISYWKPRFEDVAPGAIRKFNGDYLLNMKAIRRAYYSQSAKQFVTLGKKYQASYLVSEKSHAYNLPVAYQNNEYIVYSLTPRTYE